MLTARTRAELDETCRLCNAGPAARAMEGDITDPTHIDRLIEQSARDLGRIDAVVHCAGLAPIVPIRDMTHEQWHAVIDTNLSAAFYLAKAAWPVFERQKQGVIVNISSMAARDPFPGFGAYGAAKAAVNVFTQMLAREGQSIGVRAHTIAPGAVETAMFRALFTPEQFPRENALDPSDVAAVVGQCVAGDLRYTSGEVIYVHKTV
jgi:NAD(P)-dependent dehydrogenase (short-subunit alcohol dehydrogenase family)